MRISFKKIAIAFLVILLLSRSGRIIKALTGFGGGQILTLEPLRNSSEEGRFLVALALMALIFVVVLRVFLRRR